MDYHYLSSLERNYEQIIEGSCLTNNFSTSSSSYDTLDEAKLACILDIHCAAILNNECANVTFTLCPRGYRRMYTDWSVVDRESCLHIDTGKEIEGIF